MKLHASLPERAASAISLVGLTLLLAGPACPQGVLESMRSTDLNDYAFGVAVSASANPFVGASTSAFAYPYLTAFENPAFTKDWLVVRDGDIGIRHVTESEWEFGWVTRVQTLGLGGDDNDQAVGLLDRRWTLESGPMIGFRRFPVHVGFKLYGEVLDRHRGYTAELAFSLPREFSWGYLVPSIEADFLSDKYAAYYYGVGREEANLSRPVYGPGSAVNPNIVLRAGYRLSPRWMLTGKLDLEFLDSPIRDSPIVVKDEVWSATIGLAYNANLFQERGRDSASSLPGTLLLRIAAFGSSVDSTAQRFGESGRPGDIVDLESELGLPGSDSTLQADLIRRFAFYHRFEAGYFEFSRHAAATLDRELTFGDEIFAPGSTVGTEQETRTLQLAYGYSLLRDAQKELGVSAGLHYTRSWVKLRADDTGQSEALEAEAPLPTIGAFARVALSERWSVQADARAFALEFDRYKGSMGFFAVRLERDLGRHLAAGIGLNYYTTRLEGQELSNRGIYRATYYGPLIYVGLVL